MKRNLRHILVLIATILLCANLSGCIPTCHFDATLKPQEAKFDGKAEVDHYTPKEWCMEDFWYSPEWVCSKSPVLKIDIEGAPHATFFGGKFYGAWYRMKGDKRWRALGLFENGKPSGDMTINEEVPRGDIHSVAVATQQTKRMPSRPGNVVLYRKVK